MATKTKEYSFPQMLVVGASSGIMCEVLTLPIDTIKVRMQVFQNKYKNFSSTSRLIFKEEGIKGFYKGCTPGLLRQLFFASFRMAFFDIAIQKVGQRKGYENVNVLDRAFWGIVSGGLGITIANPFDMLKVRFQSDFNINPNSKKEKRYRNVVHAIKKIYRKEGIKAFYQSLPPNILRNSIINAAELATYTQCKVYLLRNKIFKEEGIPLFLTCSILAGSSAVFFGSPFDVIKSRMMDGKIVNGKKVLYGSIRESVFSLYKEKGFLGFYAGIVPNLQRVISGNVIMFMTREFVFSQMKSK